MIKIIVPGPAHSPPVLILDLDLRHTHVPVVAGGTDQVHSILSLGLGLRHVVRRGRMTGHDLRLLVGPGTEQHISIQVSRPDIHLISTNLFKIVIMEQNQRHPMYITYKNNLIISINNYKP